MFAAVPCAALVSVRPSFVGVRAIGLFTPDPTGASHVSVDGPFGCGGLVVILTFVHATPGGLPIITLMGAVPPVGVTGPNEYPEI